MNNTFEYQGHTFKAIGNILGGWQIKTATMSSIYFNNKEEFDHKEFYKTARKKRLSVDVYQIDGGEEEYMLCGNYFTKVYKNLKGTFKPIEEYDTWYHGKNQNNI